MGGRATKYFDGTYHETLALLVEARAYLLFEAEEDARLFCHNDRLNIIIETNRITSWLTAVMGWLLTERAVHSGELPMDALAIPDLLCTWHSSFGEKTYADNGLLPQKLESLLDRSYQVYCRVLRLDQMVRRSISEPAVIRDRAPEF